MCTLKQELFLPELIMMQAILEQKPTLPSPSRTLELLLGTLESMVGLLALLLLLSTKQVLVQLVVQFMELVCQMDFALAKMDGVDWHVIKHLLPSTVMSLR